VPLVLAAALLVALLYGAQQRLLAVAIALTASDAVFELAGLALPYSARLWAARRDCVLPAARLDLRGGGARRRGERGHAAPAVYQGAAVVCAMMAIALFLYPQTEVWQAPEGEEEAAPLADERLFHLQGELIERSLASIQPAARACASSTSWASPPTRARRCSVRELRYVKRLFDERFGTAGARSPSRAATRAGGAADRERHQPCARARAGRARDERRRGRAGALHHRARRPRPPPFRLAAAARARPLTPTALAPDAARLGHQVARGGGVRVLLGRVRRALRDDNTIVITASAADRTSFGCEGGAISPTSARRFSGTRSRKTASFTEAFEIARQIVTEREAAEHLPASLPQIAVGRSIGEVAAAALDDAGQRPDDEREEHRARERHVVDASANRNAEIAPAASAADRLPLESRAQSEPSKAIST
jgi:hypothetical protein